MRFWGPPAINQGAIKYKVLQTSSFLHRCATSVYLGTEYGQQSRALGWCCFPSVQSLLCSAVSLVAVSLLLSYSRRSLVSVSGRARARRSAACSRHHGEILGQECQMSRIWAITFIALYLYTAQYLVFAQHSDCCTKLSCMLPHALSELTNILYLIYLLFIYY